MSDFNDSLIHAKTHVRRPGKAHEVELWFANEGNADLLSYSSRFGLVKAHDGESCSPVAYEDQALFGGGIADELQDMVYEMLREKHGFTQVDQWCSEPHIRRIVEITVDRTL